MPLSPPFSAGSREWPSSFNFPQFNILRPSSGSNKELGSASLKMLTLPSSELQFPIKDRVLFFSIVMEGWLEVICNTQLASSKERGTVENVQRNKIGRKEQ
jgi:hypothetical protein